MKLTDGKPLLIHPSICPSLSAEAAKTNKKGISKPPSPTPYSQLSSPSTSTSIMESVAPTTDSAGTEPRPNRPRNHNRRQRHRNAPAAADGEATALNHPTVQRGGRGGRRRQQSPGAQRHHAPLATDTASTEQIPSSIPAGTRGRGNARRPGAFRSRGGSLPTRTVGGRTFGGQLTISTTESASGAASASGSALSPEAAAFVPSLLPPPGQTGHQRSVPRPRKRRASKSAAPDLPTRIHEDIDNGQYECAVCTNEVLRNSRIWSCKTCWSVFHLSCIKKWSTSVGAKVSQRRAEDEDPVVLAAWRCPGCNLPQEISPSNFTCWCAKETDPRSLPGLPPFSCGQTCSRPHTLPKCPHPCSSPCHAGPCPSCPQMGPTQSCFCGRQEVSKRCVDTNYEHGWSCGEICGEMMPCGEHTCERPCHEGLCGACEVLIDARCYCGQVQREIICCERGNDKQSRALRDEPKSGSKEVEEWVGIFDCGNICGHPYDCGNHSCERPCHPQEEALPHCPRSPDVVTHCPCGKTKLDEITTSSRSSCSDPIPSCDKPCLKLLECGHPCKGVCHSGDCLACLEKITINCRCGRTTSTTVCHQGTLEQPQCMRVCRATLNCGRHECGERCCSGEKKAAERQAQRKKGRPLHLAAAHALDDGFEAEHICTRTCDRPLKCGNHTCHELCHKGPCNTCREAIFDEISCACSRTVLQPPLPCGTRPPPCRFQCEREKDCGHPQVSHNCHLDNEPCPKCPFLTTKFCLCGRNQLKNQPCWLVDVRCGEVCGKTLKCGFHRCTKLCHRSGECEDAARACQQPCGKGKSCGHPCSAPCHSPFSCKEDKPCEHKIFITCDCQRIKQEARCGATKNMVGNAGKSLKCDDECARLERNRKLALALNIDPETHTDDHVPYSAETLNMYLANASWCQEQEKTLRTFAADPDAKRYRFKPMRAHQRAFLHALCEDFGFDSESLDPEPHRHVAIFKTPRFVMAPMKTLSQCARIRQQQATLASTESTSQTQQRKSNAIQEPFNAFLITKPKFALTNEELRSAIAPALTSQTLQMQLDIDFLPSEEIVLHPPRKAQSWRPATPDRVLEERLTFLKPALEQAISLQSLGKVELCRVEDGLNITRRESDGVSSGWSQVAAKTATPKTFKKVEPLKAQNGFAVLATAATKAKKQKKEKVFVEDDWEAAEEREEEKEKAASGASSGDEAGFGVGDESASDGNRMCLEAARQADGVVEG